LIETNERIIAAREMYDRLLAENSESATDLASGVTADLADTHISAPEGEVNRLQERQRAAVERVKQAGQRGEEGHDVNIHPDLQDLSFGPIGASSTNLPPPLRPSTLSDDSPDEPSHTNDYRGSLSDFSDYDSSDEETHRKAGGTSPKTRGERDYVKVSDDEDDHYTGSSTAKAPLVHTDDSDPFADPFADEVAVGPSKKY